MTRKYYPVIIFSLVLAVVLIAAVVWRYYFLPAHESHVAYTTTADIDDNEFPVDPFVDDDVPAANKRFDKAVSRLGSKKSDSALSAADVALIEGYSRGGEVSLEEALWLKKYGYPTIEQADRYQQLSDGALSAMAQQGDELAAVTLATRQAMAGGGKPAEAVLLKIAAKGSVYALEQLLMVHADYSSDLNNIVAQGYIEAMKLRGNYAPPFLMGADGLLDTPRLTTRQQALSQELGQAIIDRLNAVRSRQGEPPLPYQPRPGASESFEQSYATYIETQALLEQMKKNGTQPTTPPNSTPLPPRIPKP